MPVLPAAHHPSRRKHKTMTELFEKQELKKIDEDQNKIDREFRLERKRRLEISWLERRGY